MKVIDVVGTNYFGEWNETGTACRGVVVKDGMILLSYETVTDQWMIPGGGIEEGESEKDCVIREIEEETGYTVKPSDCVLEMDEYYENFKWVSRFFIATVEGTTERRLTEREKKVGMEPRWIPLEEAIDIFSKHASYAATDEMRRGIYLREYTALSELKHLIG